MLHSCVCEVWMCWCVTAGISVKNRCCQGFWSNSHQCCDVNPNSIRYIAIVKGPRLHLSLEMFICLAKAKFNLNNQRLHEAHSCLQCSPWHHGFLFQCLLCIRWQATDIPPSTPKTNLEHRGRQRHTERNVSSLPAGLNSVLDFCLFPRCSRQLTDVSYTPNLHSALKNYP